MPSTRTRSTVKRDGRSQLDVLIVECDSGKLVQQGLSVAETLSDFEQAWRMALGSMIGQVHKSESPISHEILRIHDNRELLAGLQELVEKYSNARTILLVGHANEVGLRMTPSHFASWSEVGNWFLPLKPTQVALLACKSGQPEAVKALTAALPTVRNVLAAPGLAVKPLWPWMSAWLLAKSFKVTIPPDVQLLLQCAAALVTKSVVYHWDRKELHHWRIADDPLLSVALQHAPALIETALRAK